MYVINVHLLFFYSKMQSSSLEKCSLPFRLSGVKGPAVKSNTVVPLKQNKEKPAVMSHKQVCSRCDCSLAGMEQQDLDVGIFMSNAAEQTGSGHENFPKLLHQHRGDMGNKICIFRASVKFSVLVILFVMKYKWEIAAECGRLYLPLCVINKHFKAPSCQCTEQMCHAATDCINQPPLPHLICLICTG